MATADEAQFYTKIMLHKKHDPESNEYKKTVKALQHIPAPMLELCAQSGLRLKLYAPGEPLSKFRDIGDNCQGFYRPSSHRIDILNPQPATIVHEVFHAIDSIQAHKIPFLWASQHRNLITKKMLKENAPNALAKTDKGEYFAEMGRIWCGAHDDDMDPAGQRTRNFGQITSPEAMQIFDHLLEKIENKLVNQGSRPYKYDAHAPLVQEAPRSRVENFLRSLLKVPKKTIASQATPETLPLPTFSPTYDHLQPQTGAYYSVRHENDATLAGRPEKWRRVGALIYPEKYERYIFNALNHMTNDKLDISGLVLSKPDKPSVYISSNKFPISYEGLPISSDKTDASHTIPFKSATNEAKLLFWNTKQGISALIDQLRQVSKSPHNNEIKAFSTDSYKDIAQYSFPYSLHASAIANPITQGIEIAGQYTHANILDKSLTIKTRTHEYCVLKNIIDIQGGIPSDTLSLLEKEQPHLVFSNNGENLQTHITSGRSREPYDAWIKGLTNPKRSRFAQVKQTIRSHSSGR